DRGRRPRRRRRLRSADRQPRLGLVSPRGRRRPPAPPAGAEMTMAKKPLQFRLNGAEKAVFVEEGQNLLDVLRRGVGDLTPKFGCGQGTCGTCTVLVDGQPQLSCLTLAETVEGASITTTAGLAAGPDLHPLQRAFMDGFAAQCGYCTP